MQGEESCGGIRAITPSGLEMKRTATAQKNKTLTRIIRIIAVKKTPKTIQLFDILYFFMIIFN
jgi:hypothetical protein